MRLPDRRFARHGTAEFFISSRGLGYLLSDQICLANMPLAWACIVIAAVLGIAFYYLVAAAEKWLKPWHSSQL
ncbi:hypothetical protein ACFPYJ_24525 [Paenibacillus solisilvae]|uniref:ABC transporter permease n=1 Tax=Paenibacillus solisilvae TaxID=2486751 RepID=A0ABW0W5A7_9BACL